MANSQRDQDNEARNSRRRPNAALSIARMAVYFGYAVAVVIEVILLLRVVLLLFKANPAAPFVESVYSYSNGLLVPFRGIFPSRAEELTGGYWDVSALFAALVYLVIIAFVGGLLTYLDRRS